ncbi:hypothetical protein [Streptomyces heilongjiangensis]|uniref:Protein kinase domain-containing protein n=1 Tax=Streptomyces heilongjiangensis TaxID=945052 RepID=A0ABW1BEJ7_9ACTN|nr:hypothetical protein [Streptomyces heilongjiangensis]MDC2951890.1 hypothetical protein [Streptomyces heilongjiangensis]
MDRSPFALFGERAAALLQDWQQDNKRRLFAVAPVESGGSGALLVSASVRDDSMQQPKRRMIIKLCPPDASSEARRLKDAWDSCPRGDTRFRTAHLVQPLYDPLPVDNGKLLFQAVAGGQQMVTLGAALRQERLPGIAAAITRSLLAEWNPDDDGSEMTASDFVTEILDRRTAPDSGLTTWTYRTLGVTPEDRWISFADHGVVPNPLCLHQGCPQDAGVISYAVRGRAHGDLHPENVMVPEDHDSRTDDFVLIDLSRFSQKALLARDPVHLLLGLIAAGFLPHLTGDARGELVDLLVGRRPSGLLIPQGLRRLVDDTRAAADAWACDVLGIATEWKHQWLLSVQACALMFSARDRFRGRPFDEGDRLWFYGLAAVAARTYLQAIGRYEPMLPAAVPAVPAPARPTCAPAQPPAPAPELSLAPSPAPTPARLPMPVHVPGEELAGPAATVVGDHHAVTAAATAPAAVQPPPLFDPQPLLATLEKIRGAFERPLEHLEHHRTTRVFGELLQSVAVRAGLLDRQLGDQIQAAGAGLPAAVDRSVYRVRRHLQKVVRDATDQRLLLAPVDTGHGSTGQGRSFSARQPSRALQEQLRKSLEALLTATRVAEQLLAHS